MTQPQPTQRTHDALTVVTNPALYADRPTLRLAAWVALMAARGNHVVQSRLNRPTAIANTPRTQAMRAKLMNAGYVR